MGDLKSNPAVIKLIEYAKEKKSVSYDEVNDFLPDSIVTSENMEEVIGILENNNVILKDEVTTDNGKETNEVREKKVKSRKSKQISHRKEE